MAKALIDFLQSKSPSRLTFWFCLSLTFALVYSLLAVQQAFSAAYVVQDDARQHVFWMQRFLDESLFPDDWIADYFQSVAPAGYRLVYRVAAGLGLDPVLFHKLLPIPLHLITAAYCFGVVLAIAPIPAAAFSGTVLLAQGLGFTDAIISGTPKAFIYPLFLAFMYYLLRRRVGPSLVAIALQGLFYPQLVFISAGVLLLRLGYWQSGKWTWAEPRDRLIIGAGLAVAVGVLLPYALQTHEFGPTISVAEARQLPEFSLPGSRSRYFDDNLEAYWLRGRSGLRLASALTPVTNGLGFLLLVLPRFPHAFPLMQRLTSGAWLLPQLIGSSLVMFGAAHLLLFRLHLPSRYTQHSFRIVLSLAAGLVLVALIDAVWRRYREQSRASRSMLSGCLALGVTALLGIPLLFYPSLVDTFPITAYEIGRVPDLYEYVRSQPNSTLVASLSEEVNNLPTFTGRSILVGSEYAIPYHLGYYRQMRARATDLIRAQYSRDGNRVRDFIATYGVTHWLIDRGAFQPGYVKNQGWIQQHPEEAEAALNDLQSGKPALSRTVKSCTVLESEGLILLEAQCIATSLSPEPL